MSLCAAQTQCPFFHSRNRLQLEFKAVENKRNICEHFQKKKIPSIYLPGHEVAWAPEGGFPGLKKKCKLQLYFTSGAQFPLWGSLRACQLKAMLKHHLSEERKSWRTESRGWKVRIRWFLWSCETDANIWEVAPLLTPASLLSDTSWGN